MTIPARLSGDYVYKFYRMLEQGDQIDEFSYAYTMRNFLNSPDPNDISAVGFAYALNNQDELAIQYFSCHVKTGGLLVANNYVAFLFRRQHYEHLHKVIFSLSEQFAGKSLTLIAALEAFRAGKIEALTVHMTRHSRLLNKQEGREDAEKFMLELISRIRGCYEDQLCQPEQLNQISSICSSILEQKRLVMGAVEISAEFGGDYVMQVKHVSPEMIAQLNSELAGEICAMASLDDCSLTARFTVARPATHGYTYDHK